MRKLKIFFITLICLLASNVAFTLGVGNIEVKSALSEPLNAEIQLFSVRPGEGDNIRVSLATLKEFTAAGIDRPLNLSYLKFKVVEKGDGNAYIKVYSDRPIREPFLDFLVDIDWPSGRLLREYTLLLDPPIFAQRKAAPIQTPVVAEPTRVIRESRPEPTPAPTFTSSPVPSAPVVKNTSGDDLFPRIDIGVASATDLDRTTRAVSAPSFTGDSYQVKKSETLWSIADKIRPDSSIGVSQMMIALQKANPDGFSNNNINGLKSGYVLRVPDLADIQAIDRYDAVNQAKQQNMLWKSAQDNLTTSATPTGTATTSGSIDGVVSDVAEKESTVKLVTPDPKSRGAQGVGEDDGVSSEKLALANEQLASKSKENDKLQDRVKSLEDQIGSMERLIELKDDTLSDLQGKLTDAKPAPVTPPLGNEVLDASEPAVEEAAPEPVDSVVTPIETDESKVNPYALDSIPEVKTPAPVAPEQVKKPEPTEQKPAETSLFDDPIILAAMIAVIVAVLAVIWLMMQRRRNNMQFPESILSGKPAASTTTTTPNAETSLLSDFAPSAMDGAMESDSSEVDPSAEADVYIAYGKHQQAEELLLNSIKQEPDRLDLRLKLMEVFHAAGNADSFLVQAKQLNDSMDDQNTALWDKAVVMGRELCPGNELFGTDDTVAAGVDDFSDLDGIGDLDDDLDLSLDMDEVTADITDSEELNIETDSTIPDMDLDSFESGANEDSDLKLEIDDLSLDVDDASKLSTETEESTETEQAIDFGEFELELDETDTGDQKATVGSDEALDLDLDSMLAEQDDSDGTDSVDSESDDAMLGMDEVATKLDLAKAYIDMGDPDGARAILDEVMVEGNNDQQSEAKGLIEQL